MNACCSPVLIGCGSTKVLRMQIYFFSASASTFLQAGVSLSPALERQAMIRPPPGTVPLQYFSKSPVQASRCAAVNSCAKAVCEVHSTAVMRMVRSIDGFLSCLDGLWGVFGKVGPLAS